MSRERIGCGKPLKTVMPLQCTLSACNATVKMSEGVGYERPLMRATFQPYTITGELRQCQAEKILVEDGCRRGTCAGHVLAEPAV